MSTLKMQFLETASLEESKLCLLPKAPHQMYTAPPQINGLWGPGGGGVSTGSWAFRNPGSRGPADAHGCSAVSWKVTQWIQLEFI